MFKILEFVKQDKKQNILDGLKSLLKRPDVSQSHKDKIIKTINECRPTTLQ